MFRVNGWNATDEGVLLARYARGVTGPALVANTLYAGRDPVAIRAAFDSVRLTFDMNGDGAVDATDALIVLRHVSGHRGSSLVAGLSLGGGSRNTLSAVEAFIDSGCVAPIATRAPIYESGANTPDRTSFLSQANQQGARAFVHLSPIFVGVQQANLYANDTPGVYTYRSIDTPTDLASFTGLLNAQGAERYRFGGVLLSGTYFVRDENSNRSFQYRVLAGPSTGAAFLTQANAQGTEGYYFVLPYAFGLSTYLIYAKETGDATYSYALQSATDQNVPVTDFVMQANAQGASGFKFRTSYQFGDGARNIYVKDTSQAATYTWKLNADVSTLTELVDQANAEGGLGNVYLGARVFFPSGFAGAPDTRIVYFKPTNCAGSVMCSPSGAF